MLCEEKYFLSLGTFYIFIKYTDTNKNLKMITLKNEILWRCRRGDLIYARVFCVALKFAISIHYFLINIFLFQLKNHYEFVYSFHPCLDYTIEQELFRV